MLCKLRVSFLIFCFLLTGPAFPRGVAAQAKPTVDRATWAARLTHLSVNNLETQQVLSDLLDLDPDTGYEIVRDNWANLANGSGLKETILGAFATAAHPRCLDVLDLGATDPSLSIQNMALYYVRAFSFQNFTEDYSAYLQWRKQTAGKPLAEVLRDSSQAFVEKLRTANDDAKWSLSTDFAGLTFNLSTPMQRLRRQAVLDAGLPELVAGWLKPDRILPGAFLLLRALNMDEDYLRRVVVPLAGKTQPVEVRSDALNLLGAPSHRWAADLLLKMLLAEYPDPISDMIVNALSQTGDPHVIPTLIGMLDADDTQEGRRLLGNALGQLTTYGMGMGREAAWWDNWWEKNRLRFPADVSAQPIPKIKLRQRAAGVNLPSIAVETHQIAGDPQRTYLLLAPAEGTANGMQGARRLGGILAPPPSPVANAPVHSRPGLLVVLAGGNGNGADVLPFWTEVAQKALKGNYLIALPVAPKWTADSPVVWVTQSSRKLVKEAKFTTEEFVADVVRDITGRRTLSPEHVFLHGAADSGPAVYACSLDEQTPFHGFYILASVFKSAQLPPLTRAKGRRYLLQHSKDDKVAPYWMAVAAQKLLSENGATVTLVPYRGNHGYDFTDDIFAQMGAGVTWLEGTK
jgi:predicted esterase